MKSSMSVLQSRGFVEESRIVIDESIDKNLLKKKLISDIPTDRTKAAMMIKKLNRKELIPDLLEALVTEKKLYSKIAIAEALIHFGDEAVERIIPYLGRIGNNQHHQLPSQPFGKDNYPCPRDIVARILVHMNVIVISKLLKQWEKFSRFQKLEAIDILGHVSFYHKNKEALPLLLELYENNRNDSVMIWKLIRAFSAFEDERVIVILNNTITRKEIEQHVCEAKRSLRLIKKRN
jgi:HEAT repeat protein